MDVLKILELLLQYGGMPAVILIFWAYDARRRDKHFEMMWHDHQDLANRSVKAIENNTKAVENLKGYVKAAI